MELDLLPDEEAGLIRIRMDEDNARKRAKQSYSDLVCAYCRQTGNSVSLRRHIKNEYVFPLLVSAWKSC